jgi:hypothetical protein
MGIDRPGALDVVIVILSPLIVAGLTVVFLLGWWAEALWGWVRGEEN